MTELAAFRVYASTPKSVEYLPNAMLKTEVHIVLAFARDYDAEGNNQTGKFVPYFDSSFDAEKIQAIRNSARGTTVKFFLSIGGRNPKYPFRISSGHREEWVRNATESLKDIVKNYRFDGIDIYYEHVTSNNDFAQAMRDVIWRLKRTENVITSASLTVSAPLNGLYNDLYKKGAADFDHVVYQSHSETSPISTFDGLVNVFFDKTINYPKTKIFAGHSDVLPSDWEKVPLPIFLGAVPKLIEKKIDSISKWIVTVADHDPEP
ncbi:hypothetical protein QN277_024115 [Acacia crassicarpa]|uniref:GH18 domain-containing protein n=1 Tax=Acacia crassicarpa TaxID=499986 RepID=A0AAE1K751_9FABA|nr:hypothetical protein QN277_024115 [Acacia crassicarpa]